MFSDIWLLAQLLLQVCSLFLLVYATVFGLQLVWKWQAEKADETQLYLEHKNYLLGAITQLVLIFQLLGLAFFMLTTNIHLPSLIKGAMCASGVLAANEYGFPLLYTKTGSVFVYILFLILQYLDNQEPAYPLTPQKYIFLFPSVLLLASDFVLQILFYAHINPDRIVTCCSLTFITETQDHTTIFAAENLIKPFLAFFVLLFVVNLVLIFSKQAKKVIYQLFATFFYVALAIFCLKYFFVKYIYGLPTHSCLFDLFLPTYYGLGFVIFASYYILLAAILFKIMLYWNRKQLQNLHASSLQTANVVIWVALLASFLIPVGYWFFWEGNL
jgi:hypothetical protein